MFWWSVFWIMWFFPRKYNYRCIRVYVWFKDDKHVIWMWIWLILKISACSTEYDICDSFASLTRHQASYSGSVHWYFRYQSIHIQITYNYHIFIFSWHKVICICLHPTPTLSDMRFLQNSHLPTRKVWRYQRGIQKPTCPLIDMSSTLYRLRANQYYTNSSLKRS